MEDKGMSSLQNCSLKHPEDVRISLVDVVKDSGGSYGAALAAVHICSILVCLKHTNLEARS